LGPGATAIVDVQLVDASAGIYLNTNIFNSGSSPPTDPDERRLWQQRHQVLSAAMDSRYIDLPSGVSALLVSWTVARSPEVTVNGREPVESSLTVFIDPVTPVVRGPFSLPGGLLTGQIRDISAAMKSPAPGLFTLASGNITYQFVLPEGLVDLDRLTVQLPVSGGSSNIQNLQFLAYNWENDSWDLLDLQTVNLQSQAGASPGQTTIIVPTSSGIISGSSRVVIVMPQYPGMAFSEALEGVLPGQDLLSKYISASRVVCIKLLIADGATIQAGTPSLTVQGVADE
jgi:hypothetical protein